MWSNHEAHYEEMRDLAKRLAKALVKLESLGYSAYVSGDHDHDNDELLAEALAAGLLKDGDA